ncbi:MAG TPA: hypothetical protein VM864_03955 [Pyrinomonadaceae bacterium]|jgi:CheY-like chemotaxis protein|nr:hypothetical protein [Pyrinomonadaceae bacterium]
MPSPETQQRILYAGNDLALLTFLRHALAQQNRAFVRCPDAVIARILIKSHNRYALLLLDAELPDATGEEPAAFARSLPHHARTPLVVAPPSADFGSLAKAVRRQLDAPRGAAERPAAPRKSPREACADAPPDERGEAERNR